MLWGSHHGDHQDGVVKVLLLLDLLQAAKPEVIRAI